MTLNPTSPGLLTDAQTSLDRAKWLRAHGYDWLSVQVQNGAAVKDRDLAPAKAAGLSAGVWGVSYSADTFRQDGERLGRQAVRLGAEHVMADIEPAAKFTRDSRGLLPYIVGIREGGWTGPVHLTPLGAPVNARPFGPNDFAVDVASFLATGGSILPQAYFNAYDEYRPDLVAAYWLACGVPADRLNVMIAVYAGEGKGGRISGAEWLPLLKAAGVHSGFSIYMEEMLQPYDLEGLHELSQGPRQALTPKTSEPTPVTPDPAAINAKIAALAETWLAPHEGDEPLARLRMIKRIATATDAGWVGVRENVASALDGDVVATAKLAEALATNARLQAALDVAARHNADLNAKIAAAKSALG